MTHLSNQNPANLASFVPWLPHDDGLNEGQVSSLPAIAGVCDLPVFEKPPPAPPGRQTGSAGLLVILIYVRYWGPSNMQDILDRSNAKGSSVLWNVPNTVRTRIEMGGPFMLLVSCHSLNDFPSHHDHPRIGVKYGCAEHADFSCHIHQISKKESDIAQML